MKPIHVPNHHVNWKAFDHYQNMHTLHLFLWLWLAMFILIGLLHLPFFNFKKRTDEKDK